MYELVSISCGEATVHYATDNLKKLGEKFQMADTSRIRHNGKLLTLAEAYELLGENTKTTYMPCKSKNRFAQCKAVERIDESGKVLARYPSVTVAAEVNGYHFETVRISCKLGRPTRTGKRFRYAEG